TLGLSATLSFTVFVVTHVSIRTSDASRTPHGSPFAGIRNAPLPFSDQLSVISDQRARAFLQGSPSVLAASEPHARLPRASVRLARTAGISDRARNEATASFPPPSPPPS